MKVDIAIMTIREDEFMAVRRRFKTERRRIPDGRTYLIGEVRTEKQTYTIAIARCSEQGTDASQRLAHYIIHNLDPQLILVVGIAGGVPRDEFTLGDVVVSTRIVNPNVDAWHPDSTTDYTTRGGPPHPLIEDIVSLLPGEPRLAGWTNTIQLERPTLDPERANIIGDDEWREKVRKSLNGHFGEEQKRDRPPIFTIGPILSSNHLVKDPVRFREILKTHRSILAMEMEVAGVYEAAQGIDHQYPVMAIRGISDIVGLQRDSRWTEYACQTAAAFTYAFIMTDPLEPPPDLASFQKPVAPSEISSAQLLGSESPSDTQHSVWHLINPFNKERRHFIASKLSEQQSRKRFSWKRKAIALIAIFFLAGATILWILSSGLIIPGIWSYIFTPVFTCVGIALSLFAWLFPLPSEQSTSSSTPQPLSIQLSAEQLTSNGKKLVTQPKLADSSLQSVGMKKKAPQSDVLPEDQPTIEHPALICFALDVSDTMIGSVIDHTGKTVKRWASIQTVLDRFVYLGAAFVKDPEARQVLPLYNIMAYGFGFSERAYPLGMSKRPGGAVRDLLSHPSLSALPSAAEITDDWSKYKDNLTSRKYTLDLLGDTPLCQALIVIRDRIKDELKRKEFTLPVLLLILSDGKPTDGDPLPLVSELHKMGVLTLCCYLDNQDVLTAKRLYKQEDQQWSDGAKCMFRMASEIRKDCYLSRAMYDYLSETGWQPQEGMHLFAQINHTEALDSFLSVLLSGFMHERGARNYDRKDEANTSI